MNKITKRLDKLLLRPIVKLLNLVLKPVGYSVGRTREAADFYLHKYSSYEEYRDVQTFHNKRKIDQIWADKATLRRVADIAASRADGGPIRGLCHGARNGFEQSFLNDLGMNISALGTDISDTATDYENSVQWDFHDVNPEWQGAFDFIYTNSLDQSWKPKDALTTWLGQLKDTGALIIEHTADHGPGGASEMDPFGVRPVVMPYVLTMWFGSQITISHSVAKKENRDKDAWLFVIGKTVSDVVPLPETGDGQGL